TGTSSLLVSRFESGQRSVPMLRLVKAARARIVKGKIVTRAKFPEGARLTILMDDDRPPIELEPEDEEARLRGFESIPAGKGAPPAAFRAPPRRPGAARMARSSVTLVPEAVVETIRIATWWRRNRRAAPRLFQLGSTPLSSIS